MCSLLWVVYLFFPTSLVLSSVWSAKLQHTSKGGFRGPPPEKFENQESRGSHLWSFRRGNFTSRKWRISEDNAPIYCMLFLNIRLRQNRHISVLDLGCTWLVDNLIQWFKYTCIRTLNPTDVNKPNWCNPLLLTSQVFLHVSSLIFHSFAGWIPRSGTFFHYSCLLLEKGWGQSTLALETVLLGSTCHSYMTSDVKQEINQKAFTLPHSFLCCLIWNLR